MTQPVQFLMDHVNATTQRIVAEIRAETASRFEMPHPETVQGTFVGTPEGFIGASTGWCFLSETDYSTPPHEPYTPNVTTSVPLPDIAARGSYDLPAWGQKQEI